MSDVKNKIEKPSSQDIWNKYQDKDSYEWKSRGIHIFNTLLKEEKEGSKKKKKKR